MRINTDITVLGGLPDFDFVLTLFRSQLLRGNAFAQSQLFTEMPTDGSVTRYKNAIRSSLLTYRSENLKSLIESALQNGITKDNLILLMLNMSANNDLFHFLNQSVYFPALYSGRLILRSEEVEACLKELKQNEEQLRNWADSTIHVTAYKYLSLLKKFGLLTGGRKKTILNVFLDDALFIQLLYWLMEVEQNPNILYSPWIRYAFTERPSFIDRVLQKRYSNLIDVQYTGDRLNIQPRLKYDQVNDASRKL